MARHSSCELNPADVSLNTAIAHISYHWQAKWLVSPGTFMSLNGQSVQHSTLTAT